MRLLWLLVLLAAAVGLSCFVQHTVKLGKLPGVKVPVTEHDPCTEGTSVSNAQYVYVCVAPNTWRRIPIQDESEF